ncbi:DEAD/DEAH box helicase [Rhizobium ruizarguesonis]
MADLFTQRISITLPERYLLRGRVAGNLIRQLAAPRADLDVALDANTKGYFSDVADRPNIALLRRGVNPPSNYDQIVRIDEVVPISSIREVLSRPSVRWQRPAPIEPAKISLEDFSERHKAIGATWNDALSLREEQYEGDRRIVTGFRPPQLGAIHAIKAHWVVSDAPSTLVMPTGTGKTETMLSVFVSTDVDKLLVIVPSDQLRTQISEKFISLGVLKKFGLIKETALYPIVATLKKAPTSLEEVDEIFGRAQVVVATMQSVSRLPVELKDRIAAHVTHLFVDEAHHIGAATWKAFKTHFVRQKRLILQFTATPYRNDNKRVDGKFIFVYPLRRAREQHLFRPVHYIPVMESDPAQADLSIIREVGNALDRDLHRELDHLAMARTSTIDRAQTLLTLYRKHLPRHAAELVHSKMSASEREDALRRLRSGAIRIIVCVDMLGEGFDLPRLKIAGLHDRHRSEAVTLQFIGRFTRAETGLGDATVIAGVSLEDPKEWLNALYKEDADWNTLLETGSESRVEHQRRREELYTGLDADFEAIPVETVTPKLNAHVFRTHCDLWGPQAVERIETPSVGLVEGPIVNDELRLVMAVTRHEDGLRWTRVKEPTNVVYNLVMAHWDQEKELLYVQSYPEDGLVVPIARLLCGTDVELLHGEAVFRVLHGFRRVMLTNLGVKETQVKPIRFQLSTGIDITEQLELTVENRSRIKTNLFGTGYLDEPVYAGDDVDEIQAGKRSIGCSTKGKIWSQEGTVSPDDWVRWCQTIGPKIADESINTEMVLRNVLRPKRQQAFPAGKIPISIDWPEGLSVSDEDRTDISFGEHSTPLSECDLEISAFETGAPVRFRLRSAGLSAEFEADIRDGVSTFRRRTDALVTITRGKRTRDILDLFREDPPAIRFTDGDMLIGADLASAPGDDKPLFDITTMEAVSWDGVDIKQESQGPERQAGTVQYATIARLLAADPAYNVIFDGDASGEVADVVAIRRQGRFLDVELYHCKFSSKDKPGARVDDLYEICGQAMKSVRWADPRSKFLQRLRRQEENRQKVGRQTRFIIGDRPILDDWLTNRRDLVTRFSMTLVQPGYSKAKAAADHLPILGSVQAYLHQTYNIRLSFWSSP